jgi:dihydrofolate reductase
VSTSDGSNRGPAARYGATVGKVKCQISISADGYLAGPNQSEEHGLGEGGEALHEWAFKTRYFQEIHGREGGEGGVSDDLVREAGEGEGAVVMGRNMFGGGHGPWGDDPWRGFWGKNPPYHAPVFVLTHHAREPLEMQGGTTFHFVTDGIDSALEQAKDAAGERDVSLAGGAKVVQQYFAAGLVDELDISIVPIILGGGERLFENLGSEPPELEQVDAVDAPGVTHIRYRTVK